MTDEPQITPADAFAKLNTLKADQTWTSALLAGNGPQVAEYQKLSTLAVSHIDGDEIGMAIAGKLYERDSQPHGHLANIALASSLKDAGLDESVIRQAITGAPVSRQERDAAERRKAALFRDQDWTTKMMAKNGPEFEEYNLLNVILAAPVKETVE